MVMTEEKDKIRRRRRRHHHKKKLEINMHHLPKAMQYRQAS